MVSGFTKFKERFQGFENQYVIIGGTACDLIMENEELPFRATKDVDIVLIVESITVEFGRQFWEYVKEAGYEHLNKSTGNAQFYRFTSPKSKEYPYMIEIFSRNPDFIILEDDAVLTPLPIDDEISSLSAILLNEAYYELLKTGQSMVDGIPVLSPTYVGWFFFAGGCICLGASGNVHTIPLTAYMQETISAEKMGRAFSVLTLISSVTMPIGLLFSSPIAEEAGVNVWFFISGLCMVILTACVSIRYSAKCRR